MAYEYEHVKPADIEATSMKIIGEELAEKGIVLSEEESTPQRTSTMRKICISAKVRWQRPEKRCCRAHAS